jgi:hypothetical protein
MWLMLKASLMSTTAREKAKWFFCALASPIASKKDVHRIVALPLRVTILNLLRRPFYRLT